MFQYPRVNDAGLVDFQEVSPSLQSIISQYYCIFQSNYVLLEEILGPVMGKTRSWGWETVFDLVPFVGEGVNKHVGGGD